MLLALSSLFETAALPIVCDESLYVDSPLDVSISGYGSVLGDEVSTIVPSNMLVGICNKTAAIGVVSATAETVLVRGGMTTVLSVVNSSLVLPTLTAISSGNIGVVANNAVGSSLITSSGQLSLPVAVDTSTGVSNGVFVVGKWLPLFGVSVSAGEVPAVAFTVSEVSAVGVDVGIGSSDWKLSGGVSVTNAVSSGLLELLAVSVGKSAAGVLAYDESVLTGNFSIVGTVPKTVVVGSAVGANVTLPVVASLNKAVLPEVVVFADNLIAMKALVAGSVDTSMCLASGEWLYAFWYTVHRAFSKSDKVLLVFKVAEKTLPELTKSDKVLLVFKVAEKTLPELTRVEKESTINGSWRIEAI